MPVPEPDHPWNVNVRAKTEQGASFSRVRVVDEPPTPGQRFLMATAAGAVAAGEDIRVITRAEAERLELPDYDLWLFDSRTLVRMHIDESDTTIGVELINDPDRVLDARQVLIEESRTEPVVEANCRIASGTWHSHYDGRVVTDPSGLDIDHTGPLRV